MGLDSPIFQDSPNFREFFQEASAVRTREAKGPGRPTYFSGDGSGCKILKMSAELADFLLRRMQDRFIQ